MGSQAHPMGRSQDWGRTAGRGVAGRGPQPGGQKASAEGTWRGIFTRTPDTHALTQPAQWHARKTGCP